MAVIFCPTCGSNQSVKAIGSCEELAPYVGETEPSVPYATHSLYQCTTCTNPIVTVWPEWFDQEDDLLIVYPLPALSPLINEVKVEDVRRDLTEADRCFHNALYHAFAAMARRVVYSICHDKNSKGDSAKERIAYLVKNGIISSYLGTLAEEIVDLGDYGAHPEWELITKEQAKEGFKRLCTLVQLVYEIPPPGASWKEQSRRYEHKRDPEKALEQEARRLEKQQLKERDRARAKEGN
ncbi:MAG: DUF4145 domain-containing protein [Candidatus Obscuribacterales bacterium]|nr:DUF4145 domain-containing protein [Candidatus Obscuribacterales bacterium]